MLFTYNAPSDVNKKLEDIFKVYDPVIKHMLVRLGKKQAAATLKAIEEENKAPAEAEAKETAPATEEAAAPAETTEPADTTKQE